MINGKSILAVILARGGSKRLPNKNLLEINGKPLISWTIEAGMKSSYIDDVVVSSDSEKILKVSNEYGANVIKRPKSLASDFSTSYESIEHTILNYKGDFNYIILLQPTSPLRNAEHIDGAIDLLIKKDGDAVISINELDYSPQLCGELPSSLSLENFIDEKYNEVRSQDISKFYKVNGAIYLCKKHKLLDEKTFYLSEKIFGYIMPSNVSIDIDNQLDFDLCQFLFNSLNVKTKI